MSDRLERQITVERQMLRQLLDTHRSVLDRCAGETPSAIEISALGAMLHAYYTGIENIFKRVAIEIDRDFAKRESWHQALLKRMAAPAAGRPAVISELLRVALKDYLDFRHVFRQGYTFQLRWEKMAPLVRNCDATFARLESERDAFVSFLRSR